MAHAIISPWTRWTPSEIADLKRLAAYKSLFRREIAERMGKKNSEVEYMLRRLGIQYLVIGRMGKWNCKHAHLREAAMTYFLTHTTEETRDHFGLTSSELKSLMTIGYKIPELKHLRKDPRRHDAWTLKETRFLIRNAGIQPRAWIAKKLDRGTHQSVKEMLFRLNSGQSRFLNGMPVGWVQFLFGDEIAERTIKTKAGPTGSVGSRGSHGDFCYRILPWVECEDLLAAGKTRPIPGIGRWNESSTRIARRYRPPNEIKILVKAMARFQRWIHGLKSSRAIRARLEKTAGEK